MTPSQLRDRASRIARSIRALTVRVRELRESGASQVETRPLVDLAGRWYSYERREQAPAFPNLELLPLSWPSIESTLKTFETDYNALSKRYALRRITPYQSTASDWLAGASGIAWIVLGAATLYLVARRR